MIRILTVALALLTASLAHGQSIDLTGRGASIQFAPREVPAAAEPLPLPAPRQWLDGDWSQVYVWPAPGEWWVADDVLIDLLNHNWTIGTTDQQHIRVLRDPQRYGVTDLPAYVVADQHGQVLRQFTPGCGQRLDVYAFQWLATGRGSDAAEQIPATAKTSGSYPLRGNWWSVENVWNAGRSVVLRHLRTSPNHRGKPWQSQPLESWTVAELHSLHSDDHEGRVRLPAAVKAAERPKPAQACPT